MPFPKDGSSIVAEEVAELIDTIDTERLWACPDLGVVGGGGCGTQEGVLPLLLLEWPLGTLRLSVAR